MKPTCAVVFFWFAAFAATCQVPSSGNTSNQVRKEWELGRHVSDDLEQRDGSINDPVILEYLQHIASSVASAAGAPAMQVRVTRSNDRYTFLLPNRLLYISGGLLERIENEAELAGLLAHELAHIPRERGSVLFRGGCVLASQIAAPGIEDLRERERQATTAAITYLKVAGYDPTGVLDLFSKLAYEQPLWAKAIVSRDLLELRVPLEAEGVPPAGYRLDSSGFREVHSKVDSALGGPIRR